MINSLVGCNSAAVLQKAPDCSNLRVASPAGSPTSTADVILGSCDNPTGPCQATEEVPVLDPAHKAPPLEAEGLRSEGDGENPELRMAAEEEDGEGNPSSGDQPSAAHSGGGPSLAGAESPNEGTSSVLAHKQQVDFKALVQEEKIVQMKAKMQQQEATLENLQVP